MFKRRTTHPRRRSRSKVLEVRVMSPRIAWFGFLNFSTGIFKLCAILAILAGSGWGVWQGVQRAFYQNPDFSLRVIDLNSNPVIDEVGVAAIIGIDPVPNIFAINVDGLTATLKGMPAVADAAVERHLPGKLQVRITPRIPRAWISCPSSGFTASRQAGSLLVDVLGIAYPCTENGLAAATKLPIIQLPTSAEHTITVGQPIRHPELGHCFRLLDSACKTDPNAADWIDSIHQGNAWSIQLVTRQGATATFGLGDHDRQIQNLRAAMDHSNQKGYLIDTINLIPKHNIPITVHSEAVIPRAVPVQEPSEAHARDSAPPRVRSTVQKR